VRITLPPDQEALIVRAAATGRPLVVVNCSGRPLSSPAAEDHAHAILHAWNLGSEAGTAIAAVLTGAVDPSGRLPVSIPRHEGQLPMHYNRKTSGKVRGLGKRYVGYLDQPCEPLYPFGFGLGYTTFALGPVRLDAETLEPGGVLQCRVAVANAGNRAGTAVIQLYLGGRYAPVTRPDRELKGFQRIDLAAGETRDVAFAISEEHLVFYRGDGTPCLSPGTYDLWVGEDSRASAHATFRVPGHRAGPVRESGG
jgi:beta-glucosidase